MDSKEFTHGVAKQLSLSDAEIVKRIAALGRVLTTCGETLDSMSVPRFGNFDIVKEDERVDIDLSTGRRVLLPPSITVRFTPSAILRKAAEKGGAL